MENTIVQYHAKIGSGTDRDAQSIVMQHLAASLNSQALASAGLVISTAGGVVAKTGASTFYALVGGRLASIAAGTNMPALTGLTITANRFNVVCFFLNSAGTVSARFGTEGSVAGAVKWPDFPLGQALIGALLITHSATFTGGTTPLDTATTVYLSPIGAVNPTFLYS